MATHTYRIQEHLGYRSTRVVCRALETDPEGYVATVELELLPRAPGLSRSLGDAAHRAAVRRLEQAVGPLLALEYAGVVPCKRIARMDQAWGLISDHVEGVALSVVIEVSEVPPRQALALVGEVAALLHHALELRPRDRLDQGAHLGLAASRILLTPKGEVAVLGWGGPAVVAELIAQQAALEPETLGRYSPPEQISTGRIEGLGPAADIYALGAILREALTPATGGEGGEPGAASADFHDPTGGAIEALLATMQAGSPSRRPSAAEVWGRCRELAVELPGEPLAAWARRVCADMDGAGAAVPGVGSRRAKSREPRVGTKLAGVLPGRPGVVEAPEIDEVGPSFMAHGRSRRSATAAVPDLSYGVDEVRPVTFEVEPRGEDDTGDELVRRDRRRSSRSMVLPAMLVAGLVLGGGLVGWRVRGGGAPVGREVAPFGELSPAPRSPLPQDPQEVAAPPAAAPEVAQALVAATPPVDPVSSEPELAVAAMTVAPPAPPLRSPPVKAQSAPAGVVKARSTQAAATPPAPSAKEARPERPSAVGAKEAPASPTPSNEDARRRAIAGLASLERAALAPGADASDVVALPPQVGWRVIGDAKAVYLTLGRSTRFDPGAILEPGRYDIWARFEEGAEARAELAGSVRVEDDGACTVRCDAELELCSGSTNAAP